MALYRNPLVWSYMRWLTWPRITPCWKEEIGLLSSSCCCPLLQIPPLPRPCASTLFTEPPGKKFLYGFCQFSFPWCYVVIQLWSLMGTSTRKDWEQAAGLIGDKTPFCINDCLEQLFYLSLHCGCSFTIIWILSSSSCWKEWGLCWWWHHHGVIMVTGMVRWANRK